MPRIATHAAGVGLLALLAVAGCLPPDEPPGVLRLEDFHQGGADGVFLNEPLTFHFSGDVDRTSATAASVRILGPGDEPVAGELEVDGDQIRFHPTLPRQGDLLDGGLRPGATYRVSLLGFPHPDGLRSRRGEPLARTATFSFVTVARGTAPEHRVFVAPLSQEVPLLRLVEGRIGALDPILLACEQALDPRSLDAGLFELRESSDLGRLLPLRVRLARNDRAAGALVELRPLTEPDGSALMALEPGSTYLLSLAPPAARPRSLGGLEVAMAWALIGQPWARFEIREHGRHRDGFDDLVGRSVERVPGVDGTALWGAGQVTLHYPAAAGSGAAGEVVLAGAPAERDVHATRLTLPADHQVDLPAEGLVVLRAQGLLEIAGTLRRGAAATAAPAMTFPPDATLTAWLDAALADDPAWTVLIAGGDLVVSGELQLAGPLLLVAGGRIRISGSVQADEIAKLGAGSGPFVRRAPTFVASPTSLVEGVRARYRALVDVPAENPLAAPLVFAVRSGPVRLPAGVTRLRTPRASGRAGAGSFRIRYLGRRAEGDATEEFGPVDDVQLLQDCDAIQFQVELLVPAADGPWDPPSVDWVELRWDEPAAR